MPISVAGIAVRSGKLFVARRKPGGAMGGRWEFPGGKCEPGESPEQALVREYQEELGLDVRPVKCLGTSAFVKDDTVYDLMAYGIEFDGEPKFLAEHDEVMWVDRSVLEDLDIAPSDRGLFPFLPD